MKVLIFSQFFWPERAAKIVDEAFRLQEAGHDVEVLTSFPCYPAGRIYPGYRQKLFHREVVNGVSVIRVPQFADHSQSAIRRMLYYVSFGITAVLLGVWRIRHADVMLVYQSAIPTGIAAWAISRIRRIPYVLDVVDLWPDSVIASGMLKNKVLLAVVGFVSRLVYQHADHVNAITDGYRTRLIEMGVTDDRISVIHHWVPQQPSDVESIQIDSALNERLRGRFNVVYTGNTGPLQALEVVIDAATLLADSHPQVQFIIIGDGLSFSELKALCERRGLANVLLVGRRPGHEMPRYYAMADALLVHLRPSIMANVSIPSKLICYLAAGRPILMGASGEAANFVQQVRCGICFQPTHGASLAQAVIRMYDAPVDQRMRWCQSAARAYRQHFEPQGQLKKMTELLHAVSRRRAA